MSQAYSGSDGAENRPAKQDSLLQVRFSDWNGGEAIAHKPENRRDDILLERPTMEMGNETLIRPEEGDPPSQSKIIKNKTIYERLSDHNRDCWWRNRIDVITTKNVDRASKRHLVRVFTNQLEMSPCQTQLVFRDFMKLALSSFGLPRELVAFSICGLIANAEAEDRGSTKVYHPQRPASKNDPHFQRLAENLISGFDRITENAITSVFNKLSQGDRPTRHPDQWKSFVRKESFLPFPSYALEALNSGDSNGKQATPYIKARTL